jgi:hypothetical protein
MEEKENMNRIFKNIPQIGIYTISFIIGSMTSIKFLKRKFLNKEFHGHFNSPQNMLNKSLSRHYIQDAIVRGTITFFTITIFLSGYKYKLGGYENHVSETLIETEEDEFKTKIYNDNYINDSIKHRENVNKYLKK